MPNPNISVQPKWFSVPPRRLDQLAVMLLLHIGISEMKFLVSPKPGLALAIALRSHREGYIGPTEKPNVHVFYTSRSHRDFHISVTELGQRLVTVGFEVKAIYTPPPPSYQLREPSEHAYISTIRFLRENHLLTCRDQDIPIQPFEP